MKKKQLILIGVGVLTVAVLYLLPKVVVDNEATGAKMESEATASSSISESHTNELSAKNRIQANQLIATFQTAPILEEKVTAAQVLAGIYKEEGIFDSAAFYWSEASTLLPSDLFIAEEAGKANYDAFSFALDKDKVEALADKTRSFPMQGITLLREILEEDPKNEEGLFNMGILSMQSGQYERAILRFEELVQFHPQNIQGQFYLGVSYFESKEKNKAKAQFELVKNMTEDPMILGSIQGYLDQL
jgi:outer membrane protein